jgi:phosphoglycolate phosphatase
MDLFFDLDGTLIDSAGGILASLRAALEEHGLTPLVPLDRALIGPPLRRTLQKVTGREDPELLDRLVQAFKDHYDGVGCLATQPFASVPEALGALASADHRLFIVTNKRLVPTLVILRHLGLEVHFAGIHALDEMPSSASSKAELVARVRAGHGLPLREGLLVGDSRDDGLAALANGLPFVFAEYGYGTLTDQEVPVAARIRDISELETSLDGLRPFLRYPEIRSPRGNS